MTIRDELYKLASEFRNILEKEYDFEDSTRCFQGLCQNIIKDFVEFLKSKGISNSKRVEGYYRNVSDEFLNYTDEYVDEEDWDNTWKHWWVQVDNYILDVTADQFHPEELHNYRVVVTEKGDSNYSLVENYTMKKLNKMLEVISGGTLDTLMRYSKTSPEFMLDKFKNDLEKVGLSFKLDRTDNDFFYLTIFDKNDILKKIRLSKKDLVTGEIDMENIL